MQRTPEPLLTSSMIQQLGATPMAWGRGLMHVFLCIACWYSGLLIFLAPVPSTLSSMYLGRTMGHLFRLLSLATVYFMTSKQEQQMGSIPFFSFLGILIISSLTSECFFRGIRPVRTVMINFLLLLSLLLAFSLPGLLSTSQGTIKSQVIGQLKIIKTEIEKNKNLIAATDSNAGDNVQKILESFNDIPALANTIVTYLPAVIVLILLIPCWAATYFLYRYVDLPENLIQFQVPEKLLYVLIPTMLIAVLGEEYINPQYHSMAMCTLVIFAIFYFFQGLGVLHHYLNKFSWPSFLKTLFVLTVVYSLWPAIVLVGLFDTWADFKKSRIRPQYNK